MPVKLKVKKNKTTKPKKSKATTPVDVHQPDVLQDDGEGEQPPAVEPPQPPQDTEVMSTAGRETPTAGRDPPPAEPRSPTPPPDGEDEDEGQVEAGNEAPGQAGAGDQAEGGAVEVDQPQKRRRKDKVPTELTLEQEEEVVEFLLDHASIYDTKKEGFRKTALKDRAWAELATRLGVDAETLRRWYRDQRTQLGKLQTKCTKSGAGEDDLTDRQRWQWQKLHFLKVHIKRKVNRRELAALDPAPTAASQPSSDTEDQPASEPGPSQSASEEEARRPRPKTITPSITPSTRRRDQGVLEELSDSAQTSQERAETLVGLTRAILQSRDGNRDLRTFADGVYESILEMPPAIRMDCRDEIHQVLSKFRRLALHQQPPAAQSTPAAQSAPAAQPAHAGPTGQCQDWQPPPQQWSNQPLQQTGSSSDVWQSGDRAWLQQKYPQNYSQWYPGQQQQDLCQMPSSQMPCNQIQSSQMPSTQMPARRHSTSAMGADFSLSSIPSLDGSFVTLDKPAQTQQQSSTLSTPPAPRSSSQGVSSIMREIRQNTDNTDTSDKTESQEK